MGRIAVDELVTEGCKALSYQSPRISGMASPGSDLLPAEAQLFLRNLRQKASLRFEHA
jgi:hypothetical protein